MTSRPLHLFAAAALTGCAASAPLVESTPSSTLIVAPIQNADAIEVRRHGDAAIITITSAFGIGRAKIEPTQSPGPIHRFIRLRYAPGKPLLTLEGFAATTAKVQFVRDSTGRGVFYPVVNGKADQATPLPHGDEPVPIREADGCLELELPADLLRESGPVEIQWIDAYR
jgi:hypothetical protein